MVAMCHEFAMSPRGRTGRRVVCAADVFRETGRRDAPRTRPVGPVSGRCMIGFLAEVQICGAITAPHARHDGSTGRSATDDTAAARAARPRGARLCADAAGRHPAPRPPNGRPTGTANMPPKPMPPSSGPRHFDTRYAPQTPHVASTISEVHASTVHRTKHD